MCVTKKAAIFRSLEHWQYSLQRTRVTNVWDENRKALINSILQLVAWNSSKVCTLIHIITMTHKVYVMSSGRQVERVLGLSILWGLHFLQDNHFSSNFSKFFGFFYFLKEESDITLPLAKYFFIFHKCLTSKSNFFALSALVITEVTPVWGIKYFAHTFSSDLPLPRWHTNADAHAVLQASIHLKLKAFTWDISLARLLPSCTATARGCSANCSPIYSTLLYHINFI